MKIDTRELLACVHALLRRQGSDVNEITFGRTSLDLDSAALRCGEHSIRLSAKEFEIMRFLFQEGGRNLSKEMILSKVWGYDSDADGGNLKRSVWREFLYRQDGRR